MSYRILEPRGLRITRVERDAQRVALHFDEARIERIMDNADQRTLWMQAGLIEVLDPELSGGLPKPPLLVAHADVEDGLYTQRDMIRIPLDVSGEVVLSLRFEGQAESLRVSGARMRLHLEGEPRYVRHVD